MGKEEGEQKAGLQGTTLTTPSLRRMGGGTYIFISPRKPYSPAEVKGLLQFFNHMWAFPRGQARDKYKTCPVSPFAHGLLTSASLSLIENNLV